MRRGFSLLELIVTLAAAAVVTAITLPRLGGVLDWLAVDAEAAKVTTGLAVTRHVAIMRGTRARLVVAVDSLRVDRWGCRGGRARHRAARAGRRGGLAGGGCRGGEGDSGRGRPPPCRDHARDAGPARRRR